MDNYNDAFALDSQGNIAVRTVTATEQQNLPNNYDDVFTLTTDGKRALRVVNGDGGGGDLPSQTGQAGNFLQTDGTSVSWQPATLITIVEW